MTVRDRGVVTICKWQLRFYKKQLSKFGRPVTKRFIKQSAVHELTTDKQNKSVLLKF